MPLLSPTTGRLTSRPYAETTATNHPSYPIGPACHHYSVKGVPSRLVYYADEGHWIETRDNALHWWDEVLGWLDRWT